MVINIHINIIIVKKKILNNKEIEMTKLYRNIAAIKERSVFYRAFNGMVSAAG